ncbi:S8 family serine peptidase [Erythrobacter alti]|uniref:S8 family serine peptidase n=1 Tax=Erythrobacter alti TaxID=1896145 RepID=UPI0030F47819
MTRPFSLIATAFAFLLAVPAGAQMGLGGVQVGVPPVQELPQNLPQNLPGSVLDPLLDRTDRLTDSLAREVQELAEDRVRRIDRLVRRNSDIIERDVRGEPARRGELLLMDASPAAILLAETRGYRVLGREEVEGLDMEVIRIAVPQGVDLGDAEADLSALLPEATVSADNLYFRSGGSALPASAPATPVRRQGTNTPVGMIDGAPGRSVPITALRGFARGAGEPSDHGSAVASLLRSAGASRIYAADVYGTDGAGGNALAIARALGWLAQQEARVITISLVGPDNPILSRAIAAAQASGAVVVAAVGNDGPAAPPAYPASYRGVVAVTAVDRRERALIEAGRALHLDYAAPGADIFGLDRRGRSQRLRGTSYATPLVAARIAAALAGGRDWRRSLDAEAHDLGPRGADDTYGRGLVCRGCGARR